MTGFLLKRISKASRNITASLYIPLPDDQTRQNAVAYTKHIPMVNKPRQTRTPCMLLHTHHTHAHVLLTHTTAYTHAYIHTRQALLRAHYMSGLSYANRTGGALQMAES